MSIEEIYQRRCNENSDICQHLPTLKKYAEKCETIVELGVRSIVSTWAFLMGKPKSLLSVDILHPSKYIDYDPNGCNLELVYQLSKESGTEFTFLEADTLKVKLPECDLMFFDTLHTYYQLSEELDLHGHKVNKYMIFHDTVTYKDELIPAIEDYMEQHNGIWSIHETFYNNNGLMVLKNNNYEY